MKFTCDICGKDSSSMKALDIHKKAKHDIIKWLVQFVWLQAFSVAKIQIKWLPSHNVLSLLKTSRAYKNTRIFCSLIFIYITVYFWRHKITLVLIFLMSEIDLKVIWQNIFICIFSVSPFLGLNFWFVEGWGQCICH